MYRWFGTSAPCVNPQWQLSFLPLIRMDIHSCCFSQFKRGPDQSDHGPLTNAGTAPTGPLGNCSCKLIPKSLVMLIWNNVPLTKRRPYRSNVRSSCSNSPISLLKRCTALAVATRRRSE
jgi:hypothetical protein